MLRPWNRRLRAETRGPLRRVVLPLLGLGLAFAAASGCKKSDCIPSPGVLEVRLQMDDAARPLARSVRVALKVGEETRERVFDLEHELEDGTATFEVRLGPDRLGDLHLEAAAYSEPGGTGAVLARGTEIVAQNESNGCSDVRLELTPGEASRDDAGVGDASDAAPANLFVNPSFEQGLEGWITEGNAAIWTTEHAYDGQNVVALVPAAGMTDSVRQDVRISTAGRYKTSFWVQAWGDRDWSGVAVYDGDWHELAANWSIPQVWGARVELSFEVKTADVGAIHVVVWYKGSNGDGGSELDDFTLSRLAD